MKTATLTYPLQHFIDIRPLAARYEVLTRAILAYLAAGQIKLVLRYSHKVLRLVKVYTRLDAQNALFVRKLEMLSHAPWRERVLKELGGLRRLKVWERARDRVLEQGDKIGQTRNPCEPSWLYSPERIAESERLKAHAQKCARAGVGPNIFRDRVKMDFDGLFRLPPLLRLKSVGRQVKVYTQNSIVDYDFNPVPFGEVKGFGPAMVWPVEFYAAMGVEGDSNSVIPHEEQRDDDGGSIIEDNTITLDPPSTSLRDLCGMTEKTGVLKVPFDQIIKPKTYRYIFENPI